MAPLVDCMYRHLLEAISSGGMPTTRVLTCPTIRCGRAHGDLKAGAFTGNIISY
jgi:hypothetical protein